MWFNFTVRMGRSPLALGKRPLGGERSFPAEYRIAVMPHINQDRRPDCMKSI